MRRALAMLLAALALLAPLGVATPGMASPTLASSTRVPARLGLAENRIYGNLHSGTAEAEGHSLFLQRDPAGFADIVTPYAAFANDPVNRRDPTGRLTKEDAEAARNEYRERIAAERKYTAANGPRNPWVGLLGLWGATTAIATIQEGPVEIDASSPTAALAVTASELTLASGVGLENSHQADITPFILVGVARGFDSIPTTDTRRVTNWVEADVEPSSSGASSGKLWIVTARPDGATSYPIVPCSPKLADFQIARVAHAEARAALADLQAAGLKRNQAAGAYGVASRIETRRSGATVRILEGLPAEALSSHKAGECVGAKAIYPAEAAGASATNGRSAVSSNWLDYAHRSLRSDVQAVCSPKQERHGSVRR